MATTLQTAHCSGPWTNIKKTLKRSDPLANSLRYLVRLFKRPRYISERKRNVELYLRSYEVKKLEIGASIASLDGWLSTDLEPLSDGTVYMDATKRFPFEEATFDFIYCEHMIEHISRQSGLHMLGECYRVLKPGGVVRIATPDLEVILGLYKRPLSREQMKYIHWVTDVEMPDAKRYRAALVINNAFHCWGHKFLYDSELMESALTESGFADIKRCSYGESEHEELKGIETHGKRIGAEDMATFETMIFEGSRLG